MGEGGEEVGKKDGRRRGRQNEEVGKMEGRGRGGKGEKRKDEGEEKSYYSILFSSDNAILSTDIHHSPLTILSDWLDFAFMSAIFSKSSDTLS